MPVDIEVTVTETKLMPKVQFKTTIKEFEPSTIYHGIGGAALGRIVDVDIQLNNIKEGIFPLVIEQVFGAVKNTIGYTENPEQDFLAATLGTELAIPQTSTYIDINEAGTDRLISVDCQILNLKIVAVEEVLVKFKQYILSSIQNLTIG